MRADQPTPSAHASRTLTRRWRGNLSSHSHKASSSGPLPAPVGNGVARIAVGTSPFAYMVSMRLCSRACSSTGDGCCDPPSSWVPKPPSFWAMLACCRQHANDWACTRAYGRHGVEGAIVRRTSWQIIGNASCSRFASQPLGAVWSCVHIHDTEIQRVYHNTLVPQPQACSFTDGA